MWHTTRTAMVLLVICGGAGMLRAEEADRLVGVYNCIGTYPDRPPYQGIVTIAKGEGDPGIYRLTWEIGQSKYVGVGILEGEILSTSWAIETDTGVLLGVVVYKLEGTRLKGRWTQYPGNGRIFSETLTKR